MKRNKGFTLIELLAVIVVLAIIALIAVPVVLNIIDKARIGAFKDSVYGVLDSAQYYYYQNPNTIQVSVSDLNMKGGKFKEGTIKYENKVFVASNITDGEYCANGTNENLRIDKGNCNLNLGEASITMFLKKIGLNYLVVEVKAEEMKDNFYSYEYRLTDIKGNVVKDWTVSQETNYTFDNLKEDSEYIVEAKLKTEKLTRPIFSRDTNTYTKSKVITITYPYYEDYSFEYYYSLDGENWTKTENLTEEVTIDDNITVYARVKDKENDYYATYTESKIDKILPTIEILGEAEIEVGEKTNLLSLVKANDNTGIYTVSSNIVDTTSYRPGKYDIEYTVTDQAGNEVKATTKLNVTMGVDNSGASNPVLNGLVAVSYDHNSKAWRKVTEQKDWYNYDKKYWANAVKLVNKSISYDNGDIIPENNIESFFVWIPRYRYKLFNLGNYTNSNKAIAIDIKFGDYTTNDSRNGECTTPMTSGSTGNCSVGDYMTHPAFISMNATGLWVGKYETGYNGATSATSAQVNSNDSSKIIIKPNVYSWRNVTVSNMFIASYNYDRQNDSHMMKNTEWGAVAYLSHSKYGINNEITTNTNASYLTGYGLGSQYNTDIGYKASSTGNITGVYDMSGGAFEYVAAYSVLGSSGFTTSTVATYNSKYFDIYLPTSIATSYNNKILGDATGETIYWYNDYANFVEASYPWFFRGGYYYDSVLSGQFSFSGLTGGIYSHIGFRIVLTN